MVFYVFTFKKLWLWAVCTINQVVLFMLCLFHIEHVLGVRSMEVCPSQSIPEKHASIPLQFFNFKTMNQKLHSSTRFVRTHSWFVRVEVPVLVSSVGGR